MEDLYYMIAFTNTHAAMKVQKELNERGFHIAVMPTLREITASCGLSVRFSPDILSEIQKAVNDMDVEPLLYQFYMVDTTMGKNKVTKLD